MEQWQTKNRDGDNVTVTKIQDHKYLVHKDNYYGITITGLKDIECVDFVGGGPMYCVGQELNNERISHIEPLKYSLLIKTKS